MLYDLQNFRLHDMIEAGRKLRQPSPHHGSMEEAAVAVTEFFYDNLRDGKSPEGAPNCVLARCFKIHSFGALPDHLRERATALAGSQPLSPETQCLILLASRGECAAWNTRFTSASHQVIPLVNVEMVARAPMIAQLFLQLGVAIENVVRPTPQNGLPNQTFGVFYVESARGSDSVPAQEHFVQPFGIKSVLGFGGLLPAGDLFAIILFTRVTISPETAALFRTLALGVKLNLLPFSGRQVFLEQ